jgi:GR25 family glycosyltransferase involved in LPS biosynthesis
MDEIQINALNKIIHFLKTNTLVKEKKYFPKNPNKKLSLWKEITSSLYVVGFQDLEHFFIDEANKQGFSILLNHVNPTHVSELDNFLEEEKNIILDLFEKNDVGHEPLMAIGCHTSHLVALEHFLKNTNDDFAFIFEEDCKFNFILSDEYLIELGNLLKSDLGKDINFLHLGYEHSHKNNLFNTKNFSINLLTDNNMTHSYLISREQAKKFCDTHDFTKPITKLNDWVFENSETYDKVKNKQDIIYRTQCDDYFSYFCKCHGFKKSVTFQQNIGENSEKGFKYV